MIKKRILCENLAPQARFFVKGKIYQKKCAADRIFGSSPHGYSVLLMQYVIYFPQITAQNLLL